MFAIGAALPVLTATVAPTSSLAIAVTVLSLISLAALGGMAARVGGARATVGAARVAFWGALAMAVTAGVGRLFGTAVL
jgi:VIT1/CCC1 family predicted Fe2+/Mn2+ transporter